MTATSNLPVYQHRQSATVTLIALGAGFLLTAGLGFVLGVHATEAAVICGAVAVLMLVLMVLFASLSVEVTREHVRLAFGVGLIRRTIPLARIRAATAVRNSWWWGWGIRLTPRGWMWNVSGLDGVELELAGGNRFRIGTDDPQGLASAITAAAARLR